MTIIQAVISGFVQGVTEFFPISSSGHLVILHNLFGFRQDMLAFDVFLHFGTILSIVIFFRKDIYGMFRKDMRLLKFIAIASVPTFIIGMIFKDIVEGFFSTPLAVGIFLIITGIFLLFSSSFAIYWKIVKRRKPLGVKNSIAIGIAQGISVLPGISRSGATIGTSLIAGLDEAEALKFSFLLSIPAVLGANILKVRQIYGNLISGDTVVFLAGAIAAAITGFLAIKVLFGVLRKNLFFLFGIYCILIGAAAVMLCR
ncbi:MAG: undecaprenyl-diphosphate phosphatase [Candidatus Omnitrophota bacterium]|jgi:undecaprenyl-diphosphatase